MAIGMVNNEMTKLLKQVETLSTENKILRSHDRTTDKEGQSQNSVWLQGQLKDFKAQIFDLRH